MRRIAVGLLIWTCSFLSLGLAQEMDFFVETYTTKDGLASNMVYAVAEDQQGYVWFGTANGLSRFDGAVFQLMYQPDSTKAVGSCLNHPTVKALLIDQAGNIWVGTQGGGLNRIDHQSQRVSYYLHDPTDSSSIMHNQILSLLEGPDGNIWVGTEKGLSIFHPEEERFYNHYADKADESKLFSSAVLDLSLDQAGDIWFGTWGGTVHRVVRKEQTPLDALWFQRFPHRNMAINSSSDKAIWGIHADQHGRLWGGTFGQGLVVRNLQSEDSRWHRFAPSQRTDMVKEVFSILEDQAGRIWVAAGEGLAIIEMPNADSLSLQQQLRAATIHRFQQLPGLTHGFASNQLRDLYEASNGLIWIAFEGGVAKYDPDLSRFTSVLNAQAQTEPITVQAICRGPNQWLWLGTQDHGLIRIHKEQGKQSRLVHQAGNSRSLLPGEIHTVKQIGGEIWAGTDHGLSVVDPSRFSIRNYPLNHPESDPPASVYDLEIGPDSLIYLASHEGLIQLDPQTMAFRFFQYDPQTPNGLPENHLNDVAIEADGTIWLGTASHGLVEARLNELGELICTTHLADPEDPLSLFNKDFLSVLPTKDHIWIGSVQGLQWMDRATLEFDRAGMEAGLPTPNVTGLQIDESGFVWCGTNPGIARFNPETRHFTLFGSRNGIKSSKHFRCGSFQDESGFLYFGGNDGLSYFDPTEVEREYLPPAIQFNGVRIGDQPVRVMEEDPYLGEPILRQPLNQLEEIQLSYRHRVLRIDFSVINFRFADLSSLAYRLTGVEEHWNYGHTQRSATYTNLSPGTYVFQVRTANHEGKWSPQPRELTIVVHPPFWDTWWFQTGVGLAALILGFLIYWYRVRTIKVQNQILQQKVQERTLELRQASEQAIMAQQEAEDASKTKSEFLANMSHEIRTPMNGVLGMAELLDDETLRPEQQDYLQTIRKSGENLLSLINDILDFSKIESGKLELDMVSFSIEELVEEVVNLFGGKISEKPVDLFYYLDPEVPAIIEGDSLRLRQILINLIGNALKFTHEGEILVAVSMEEASETEWEVGQACRIRFSVQDTGIGIPESRQETLFAAFTQVDASITRKYGGTGLGLAISSQLVQLMGGKMAVSSAVGEGSEFSFSIRTTVQPDRGNLQLSPDKLAQIRGKTVLVVEDNETHLKLLNIKLTRWGVETICVQDGKQAKALIDQPIALDLVLTDLFLPEVDGQELAEYLQQQRPKTPVILFSSLGSIQPMKETGLFEAVLAKPLRQKAVFRAIFQALFPEESGVPQTDKPNLEANQPPNAPLPGRLLLAEDNLVNQKLALRMLEKLGYQAEVANNGLEAIAKLNEQVFDIILMDVQMPGLDGLEATRRIREEFPPDLQPIIIAMTANAMKGDREMCIDAGMDDYISKPFRMAKLGEMLQQYLAAIHVSK